MTLFDGWDSIVRVLVVGSLAYAAMVLILRVSGKRTLSKMNAFDLVVTIALGSILGAILTDGSLALATGVTAIAVLVLSQLVITFLSVRWEVVERVVKAEPTLLISDGRLLRGNMRKVRVSEAELNAALRDSGIGSVDYVQAAVLETDGSVTVISGSDSELDTVEAVRADT